MYPIDPCLHKTNLHAHEKLFYKILKKLPDEKSNEMFCKLMTTKNQKSVNDQLPKFLKKYEAINFAVCSGSLKQNLNAYVQLLKKVQG